MFRIFSRPKGAPINDPRVGQPMWSKPGTPLDRAAKVMRKFYQNNPRRQYREPDMSIRQQRRAFQQGKFYA